MLAGLLLFEQIHREGFVAEFVPQDLGVYTGAAHGVQVHAAITQSRGGDGAATGRTADDRRMLPNRILTVFGRMTVQYIQIVDGCHTDDDHCGRGVHENLPVIHSLPAFAEFG